MRATPGIVIFQQEFPNTLGNPEQKSGFLPAKIYEYKYQRNLNISNMRVSGEFGEYEQ